MENEDTKNHIIKVAAPVFNKYGYVGTSLSDILNNTTLTKGAIYHYFENKDDLALAALEYNLKLISEFNFSSIKSKSHSCDKLIAFAETFKKHYEAMKQMGGCPIINSLVDADDGNELIKNRVGKFIKMWKKSLKGIVEHGKLNSEIKPDVDSEYFSINFISLIEGSIAMSKGLDDRNFLDHAVNLLISIIEDIRIK
ncbi:MAG: TetR/AcrR family transcriptional regulator [Spirochaetes bacterium]|nr:TetR/AcrR family transcriptional regulator [Spirochaetota bacterium]